MREELSGFYETCVNYEKLCQGCSAQSVSLYSDSSRNTTIDFEHLEAMRVKSLESTAATDSNRTTLTIIYTSPSEKPLRTDDIVPDSLQHGEEWYHRVILPRQMQLEK